MTTTLTVQLMFQGQANNALAYYAGAIAGFVLLRKTLYGPHGPGVEGTVQEAVFSIGAQVVQCIDIPVAHDFDFTPSTSLCLTIETQEQVGETFAALAEGGKELMPLGNYGFNPLFGWVQDRFGVSWQLMLAQP